MKYLQLLLRLLTRFWTLILAGAIWLLSSRKNRRIAAIATVVILITGITLAELTLDKRHLPWRPLAIDERAGFATEFKLRAINMGPASWCTDLLARSEQLETTPIDAFDDGDCGWPQAYHLDVSHSAIMTGKSVYPMQCSLAAGAHIWIRSIDHHAQNLLGSPLKRVHHAGTYSCRRMYNRSSGKMSEHAFAKAWDVTGFELDDGRVVSVLKHWNENGVQSRFLRAVHDDACRIFNVTLGPDYNAAHRDHFHVDVGGGISCR